MERARFSRRQMAFSVLNFVLATSLLPLASTQYLSIPEQLSGIFAGTNENEWRFNTNWHTDMPYCTWYGIYCYEDEDDARFGKIRMIDLSDNRLVGTISPDIWRLSELKILELRNNPFLDIDFSGIGGSLEKLVLSNTGFKSFYGLDGAYNLRELHLTECNLRGTIPDEIYDLKSLEGLFANYNSFTGSLPDKLGRLTELRKLFLFDNEIVGSLPDAIGELKKLEGLVLTKNALSGTLPADALNKLGELQILALNRDEDEYKGGITGSLPSFNNLGKLTEIYLQNNLIDGTIPMDFLWNAPKEELLIVDISNNQLSGRLESSQLKNFEIMMLSVAGNNFIGIDQNICYNEEWMGGDVGEYGCDAIACPVRTYAPEGRRTYYDVCKPCGGSQVIGAYECALDDNTQRKILNDFYWAMDGDKWTFDNWYDDSHECEWGGIFCNDDLEVIEINLSSSKLSGNPGSDIFLLPQLQSLDLSDNFIDFHFDGISNAKNLETLTLYSTGLYSLSDIDQLLQTSVSELYLSANNLRGPIPDSIYDIVGLEVLMMSHNNLSGTISKDISKLSNLRIFRAYGNNLTGSIPSEVGLLRGLNELILSENDLTGIIPHQFNDMPELEELSIHQTTNTRGGLTGTLPDFANCKNLSLLHLASNSISGPLPDDFLKFSDVLEYVIDVDLSDNDITGAIPMEWNRIPYLDIDLTDNKIVSISSGLCSQTSEWQSGDVRSYGCEAILCSQGSFNALGMRGSFSSTCEICPTSMYMGATQCGDTDENDPIQILEAFYISTNGQNWDVTEGWLTDENYCRWYGIVCEGNEVVKIDLSDNGLSGVPTDVLYNLVKLKELDLESNNIDFNFRGIENAAQLEHIYLSSTNVRSIEGIGGAQKLVTLHLTDCYLSGSIPNEIYSLTNLEELYLNYNQFSGRLSSNIGNLINLEAIYLTSNELSGQIPYNIGNLHKLKILALAENMLGGTIPEEMNTLTDLEILSLQRQIDDDRGSGLGGPLPSFSALRRLQKLYLGYNDLSGTIPTDFLNGIEAKSSSIEIELTSNLLTGQVPSSLNQFDKLDIFLANNYFTDLPVGLCNMENWMNGEVASISCDAIMCAPGTYSIYGRNDYGNSTCEECPTSTSTPYWGSFSCITEETASAQGEQAILEMLYTSLGGYNWHFHENWMNSEVSFCKWQGITCTSGSTESVQAIRLSNNALIGEVPNAIFDLENLRDLNLSGNSINLKLDSIDKANKLQYLNLEDTGLETLQGIEDAPALQILHISKNQFKEFPSEILSLDRLETLAMSYNAFEGNMIDLRGIKESLTFLECDECGFDGLLPEWLNEFKKLKHLSLAGNKFVGSIPTFESMSFLDHLDLSDQISRGGGIEGNLPTFATLVSLSELYLNKNKLDGSIPAEFLSDATADYIRVDLTKNMIEGTIPVALFDRFDDLTLLLANNKISMIPPEICEDGNFTYGWNSGDMEDYGCDGILCEPGFYSAVGRQTVLYDCVRCTEEGFTKFYGSTSCGKNEVKDTLEVFYYNLGGADWLENDNWMDTEDVCEWFGIECDSGSVVAINLDENGLSGEVPNALFDIQTLIELDLKSNDISFSFEGIEKLTQLEVLALSDIGITSVKGISKLSETLKELHLTDNSLATFPEELYELTNLKDLYLNYNDIEDSLSDKIGDMTALENLFIFENKMTGTLPKELGNLLNLKALALGGNLFTGSIPTEINKLLNLEILAIQRAETSVMGLTGDLPAFDGLPMVREIYLANQKLSGTIPDAFLGSVNNKQDYLLVDLSMNNIEGSLPFALKIFKSLDIYLGGNEIENIDESFCFLDNWMGGKVHDFGCDAILCPRGSYNMYGKQTDDDTECLPCPFTYTAMFWGSDSCSADSTDYDEREILALFYDSTGGTGWLERSNWKEDSVSICDWYGIHCASDDDPGASKVVKQLQLPSNGLTGTVPPQIFGLKHLEMLNLGNNHIDFEFHGIGEAMMLKELYLDSTDISDINGIGESKYLRNLHLQQNEFGGSTVPDELFELSDLKQLYLSDSNLSGKLSPKIGQLTKLEDFYCHGNDLTGTIPTEIGKLVGLEVLVLSENRFIGKIPTEINNLFQLQSLYIDSFTRRNAGLSGPLPNFSGMQVIQEIYLGSNSLTGYFPDDFLSGLINKNQKVTVGLKSNRLEGTLSSSLSSLGRLDIDISDNFITGIDHELCLMNKWNKGAVDRFKCDALLCPAGYFNQFGYQLNDRSPCKKCGGLEESSFLGVTVCQSEVKQREREILEDFYYACKGDEWKNNENWLDPNVDICNWYGISCKQGGTVDSILLGSNNLVGTPPREIFQLTNLKWLWLYSNPIQFSFHGIEEAQHLTSLLLDSTGLKSVEGIGNAYQLVDLDLRFNALSGSVPNEISSLINLESLSLTENHLSGTIPSLSRLHRLKSLRLGENEFTGLLPDFSTHTKLKTLDCSGNMISGEIPESFLASTEIDKEMFIDLSSNRLRGKVPGSLDRFDQMTVLLKDNYISNIDPELCDNKAWNDGDVELFECDGLLCPPGTYAAGKGRQSNDGSQCVECREAIFYGQSECIDLQNARENSGATISYGIAIILSTLFCLLVI